VHLAVSTKQRILQVTKQLLLNRRSDQLRIEDVSSEANVSVHTIYYHFSSRRHLIAEAQLETYSAMANELSAYEVLAREAVNEDREEEFWTAICDDFFHAWSRQFGDDWRVVRLLVDVWVDAESLSSLSSVIQNRFDVWLRLLEDARSRGWVDPNVDLGALLVSCWAASIGQVIFSNFKEPAYTVSGIRDLFVCVAKAKRNEVA
jgi:AcrR family transcriptional regulator